MRFSGFDDEWIEEKLGNLVQIKSGECTKNLITGIDNSIPYFKVEQLNNSLKYQIKTPYFINDKSKIVNKGSIIFPKRGAAILLNKIRILNQDSFMDTNLMTLTPNNKLYNEFLYYFIYKENLSKIADTTSIPQLNNKHIKPYPIKLPSFEEQLKISKFISSVDKKVALLSQNLEIFNDFKKGLLQQIFTQKLRFDNSSKIQKEIQLSDVISIINKRNKNDENIPVLSISNKFGFISQTEQFEDREVASSDKKNYKIVNKGEFAYNPARINVGSIAQLKNYEKGIISPMYIVFKVDSNVLNQTYFENFLDSDYFRYEMMKRLEGSVRMILSADSLKNIKITIPSIDEQEKLSKVFLAFDKKIKITKYQLDKTQEFKKGLLQQMFVVRINWRCNFKLAKSPSFNKHLLILKNKIIFIIIK